MKMWDGRFKKEIDAKVNDFNSSISFDSKLYEEDIEGSTAHAKMLGKCGIISKEDSELIVKELANIKNDIESGKIEFTADYEDIHMNIESILTQRIGDAVKRLHTARSRNDQVALDVKLYLRKQTLSVINELKNLLSVICEKAKENTDTVMPGYTHLQRAQPVTFAHYILAYSEMFRRDIDRLKCSYNRMNTMPLGSGALSATTYPIDRNYVSELLGFERPTNNSIDGVSDRDHVCDVIYDLSMVMMHLSRFSEEIILWCSSEFSFIELDDAFSTGSSIMPQKKNPDIAELVRGKTGRIYGDLTTILTVMKGIPLAYNKDMQEDKECLFDALENTILCISVFADMFKTLTVKKDNLKNAGSKGFINATDCADYLVKKGLPFRDAYKIIGKTVAYCIEKGKTLDTLSLEEYKEISPLFEEDIYGEIDLMNCVAGRKPIGGPSKESVNNQIQILEDFIKNI